MANTAPAAKKSSRLITPQFRVSFPNVFEKAAYNGGTPRYSLTALFYPKTFSDSDKAKWQAILAALDKVSIEGFKKPMKELDRGVYKLPFHKGDEKDYAGYGDPDMRYCTLGVANYRPKILDRNNNPITAENAEEFYAGCWARASVNPYWFNKIGKGLSLGLGHLQKLRDDDSFAGGSTAEDDFGSDPLEDFGDDSSFSEDDDPTA